MTKMTDTAARRLHRGRHQGAAPADRAQPRRPAWPRWPSGTRSTYLAYLADVLAAEVDDRAERRRHRRVHRGPLPADQATGRLRRLRLSGVNAATISMLASCTYLDRANPSSCWVTRGPAKVTSSSAWAWRPVSRAARCVMSPAPDWSMNWSKRRRTPAVAIRRPLWAPRPALPRRARLRPARHPRGRAALPDPDRARGEVLGGHRPRICRSPNGARSSPIPRLVAAIVDRLTFNAHIIETGTESFRLRSTKAKRGK